MNNQPVEEEKQTPFQALLNNFNRDMLDLSLLNHMTELIKKVMRTPYIADTDSLYVNCVFTGNSIVYTHSLHPNFQKILSKLCRTGKNALLDKLKLRFTEYKLGMIEFYQRGAKDLECISVEVLDTQPSK